MDYVLGQDAVVPVEIRNMFTGAPVLGATIGAWSLYGPASTTALTTGTTGTEAGNGVYYLTGATAFITIPGAYRLVYAVTLPAAGVSANQTATFLVGPAPLRGAQRLRDLLVSIIRGVGGSVRPSTTINTTTVTDDYWSDSGAAAAIGAEDFSGSELVVIDPSTAATYADWPHGRVVSFNATTGAFTLNRTTGLSSDSTKRMYALTNVQGTGFSFEQILAELQVAYDEVQPTFLGSVSVELESDANTLEYTLPSYLSSLARVYVRDQGAQPADLWDNIDGRWTLLRDRRLLRLDDGLGLGDGHNIRVEGAIRCELPKLGGGWTDMPGVWLRERTRFGLFSSSPNPTHQRAASVIYANLARMPNPHRVHIPGEIRL